jgi:membrane protease YdiL (CAAX protease family)
MVWNFHGNYVGVPFSICYIKTKNMYVPMMAHFITNLIGNGSSVIIGIIHLLQ